MTNSADVPPGIAALHDEMTQWRRHLHTHPETAFEEVETAKFVAERLRSFSGIEVHEGLAGTGVVGVLKGIGPGPMIGLRADMDALDIKECTHVPWASRRDGKMHACGHDGHTTMLLGAAKYLSETRDFSGTLVFIFQPAEENEGGGRVMVEEGLFEKFPVDEVYGLHNQPGMPLGTAAVRAGPVMASYDIFEVTVKGSGGHAAEPHLGAAPLVAAAAIVGGLQTITSRKAAPHEALVVSCTQIHGGSAWNVIPSEVTIRGTVRAFSVANQDMAEEQIALIAQSIATANGVEADVRYERRYPPTINHIDETEHAATALSAVLGGGQVIRDVDPDMGAEDFAFMLQVKPGAYIGLGIGEHVSHLHSPEYDFNDEALPIGAAYWDRLARQRLAARLSR